MSQHDMTIANQGFPDFRSDLNAALQALASLSSGTTAPSTTYAGMLWNDTQNNQLKIRNEANNGWHILGPNDGHHAANTIRGRQSGTGDLQDLTPAQVKTLLSLDAQGILTALKTVDGANSGVDADLLDGQHGTYYRNAGNINAGIMAIARLPTGTGVNQILKFAESGKLPALDGSALTKIPAPDHLTVSKLPFSPSGYGAYRSGGCIMRDNSLRVWGKASNGQLGQGQWGLSNRSAPRSPAFNLGGPQREVKKWIRSAYDNWVLYENGEVWVWGQNNTGQLGQGHTSIVYKPHKIVNGIGNQKIKDIAVGTYAHLGYNHVLFVTENGQLWGCGYNAYGQVGNNTTTNQTSPVRIGTASDWDKIYCGSGNYGTSFAISTGGNLYAWGYNGYGQLGVGDTTNRQSPTFINAFGGVSVDEVSSRTDDYAGSSGHTPAGHTIALLSNGNIYTWGYNAYGQLGLGNTTQFDSPQQVLTFGSNNREVHAFGGFYGASLIVKDDGNVYGCGYNASGWMGNGNTTNQNTFTSMPNFKEDKQSGNSEDLVELSHGLGRSRLRPGDVGLSGSGWNGAVGERDHLLGITPSGALTYNQAIAFVERIGARLPTRDELFNGVGGSSGAGYDSYRVWSQTPGTVDSSKVICPLGASGNTDTQELNKTTDTAYVTYVYDVNRGNGNIVKVQPIGGYGYNSVAILYDDGSVKVAGYNGNGQLGVGTNANVTTADYMDIDRNMKITDICVMGVASEASLGLLTEEGKYLQTGYAGESQLPEDDDESTSTAMTVNF